MNTTLPSAWRYAKIGKCCTIVSGATPRRNVPQYWGKDIPWVTPKDLSNLEGPVLKDTPEYISKEGYRSCSATILPKGSILFSSRAPIGLVSIAGRDMCTNQGFKSLIPGQDVYSGYLYHCMKWMAPKIADMGNGATFKEVSKEVVSRVEIPLPPLSEQKRIAAVLDKADAIRRKRQAAIKLADEFLRAVFLDMFGDPVTNPKGWEVYPIMDLGKVITGSTPSSQKDGMFGGKIPFVTPGDLESDSDAKRYVTEEGAKNSRTVREGATLVCCIGATIGKVDMAQSFCAFNQQINAIEWGDSVADIYGYWAMRFLKSLVIKKAITTTLPILKKSLFETIEIPLPSLDLQKKFESVFLKHLSGINLEKAMLEQLELLFRSLIQRAFHGEL
ncbi:MAG: restriction endonuclease subunit S [Deltaproteobacteria bacterium]|nr:restriction endonuclease subunit S [Deltaproteobacteria bacterium]